MSKINSCVICTQKNFLKSYEDRFAPWISNKILDSDVEVKLIKCSFCCSLFFDYRYNNNEIDKIYGNYRSDDYANSRSEFESGYKELNDKMLNDATEVKNRKKNLSGLIQKLIPDIDSIETVLDYGGDKGQYIPDDFKNAKRFLYDISDSQPQDNVIREESIEGKLYDFIMICHTLEHVNYPMELIKSISKNLTENGYLYIELPFDIPMKAMFSFALKQERLMENLSVGMHEHINFFTTKSIKEVTKHLEYRLLHNSVHKIDFGYSESQIICALIQKTNSYSDRSSSYLFNDVMKLLSFKIQKKLKSLFKKTL